MSEGEEGGNRISRRRLLGGIATVGSFGAVSGAATESGLLDLESFDENLFSVGKLDVRLGWWKIVNGKVKDNFPENEGFPETPPQSISELHFDDLVDSVGPTISFSDVKPGDSGSVIIPFQVCDNRSYVWLRITSHDNKENKLTWKEKLLGGDYSEGEGELRDFLRTRLWLDSDCDGKFDEDNDTIFTSHLDDTVLLGSRNEEKDESECLQIGKVDYDEETGKFVSEDATILEENGGLVFEFNPDWTEEKVEIEVTNFHHKDRDEDDSDLTGIDVTSSHRLCKAVVAGGPTFSGDSNPPAQIGRPDSGDDEEENENNGFGPGTVEHKLGCSRIGKNLLAPRKEDRGKHYGFSHVVFYACKGGAIEKKCFDFECPDGEPECITFAWELPKEEKFWKKHFGNKDVDAVINDSLKIDIELHAVQCRHNADPRNPWLAEEGGGEDD